MKPGAVNRQVRYCYKFENGPKFSEQCEIFF